MSGQNTALLLAMWRALSCSVLIYLPSRLLPDQQAGSLTCGMEPLLYINVIMERALPVPVHVEKSDCRVTSCAGTKV